MIPGAREVDKRKFFESESGVGLFFLLFFFLTPRLVAASRGRLGGEVFEGEGKRRNGKKSRVWSLTHSLSFSLSLSLSLSL